MKQFFKFMFASMLGFIISGVILILILLGILGGIASQAGKKEIIIEKNSVLKLDLNYYIKERTSDNVFDKLNFSTFESNNNVGLNEVIACIKKAETDENIKGIYLELGINLNSFATIEEIRNQLLKFKKSGKFIIAYGELADQKSYYLGSVANKIYMNPAGELVLNGLSSSVAYLKNMFDKIGVKPELIRHGKYKSAGEPLIADKMSEENRTQTISYLSSLNKTMLDGIALQRNKPYNFVQNVFNELLVQSPTDALKLGLIDGLTYADEFTSELNKWSKSEDKSKIVSLSKYNNVKATDVSTSDNKIAIIYCDGEIVSGESTEENMGSETIAKAIEKVRTDSNYKAIVLRINSPGGSAMASDVIWREVVLAKKSKPVIVSMANVAASGGYYIAAPATTIVAQPNTITGSIGVFGLLLNAEELLKNKMGVNIETVKTGKFADLGSIDRPLTTTERAIIQKGVDKIYLDFITKVAEGRKLSIQQVDSIAQGRVWAATDAKKIGLIDEFGGLDKAIEIAKTKTKISDCRIISFPEQKNPFESLLNSLSEQANTYFTNKNFSKEQIKVLKEIQRVQQYKGIQARMPYNLNIN